MATRLKSVLENPRSVLVFKTLLFGSFLLLVKIGDFALVPIIFFLLVAFSLFLKPLFQTINYFIPFCLFLILGLIFLNYLPGLYFWGGILFLCFLFYLLLGTKNLILVNRAGAYLIFSLGLFYLAFLLFFLSDKESGFIFKLLIVFLITVLLFRNIFKFQAGAAVTLRRRSIVSWILALLVFEAIWAISLLPIGFFQSANLALLTVFILQNLTLNYFQGILTRRAILNEATIFILLALLIFITSSWAI